MRSEIFGTLPGGDEVGSVVLQNARGMSVEIISYGATITRWEVPDSLGRICDVVLGFDGLEGYLGNHPYFGAVVGRVAGRISQAKFSCDGKTYQLDANDHPNHLHGGKQGLSRKNWTIVETGGRAGAEFVSLRCISPDGEDGYPGTVEVLLTYSLGDDNVLTMDYEAATDRATPFSITQHTYFNLSGSEQAADHVLQIHADEYALMDERFGLTGRKGRVEESNDFNQRQRLGDRIPQLFKSHGDLYFIRRPAPGEVEAARLTDPSSGRELVVTTTEDCVQFYTGAYLDGSQIGKSGHRYGRFAGVCLECEGYPDAMNSPALGDILLRPGQPRRHTTRYGFPAA